MKKIAVINDISGFGKCSLSAALPVISAHNIQCCPLPTGVFSNQTGYDSFESADMTPYLKAFIGEWKKLNPVFDGILTGFIPNSEQGSIILGFIRDFKSENTVVAVDPIMGDDGEIYPCYDEKSIAAVKALAKCADLITPNVTELALLCSMPLGKEYSVGEIEKMCRSLGNKLIAVTGITLNENEIANAVYDGESFNLVTSVKHGGHFSGTGDIFSAYVISEYINSRDFYASVKAAASFIEKAVAATEYDPSESYVAEGIDFERFLKIV
ncbi:MAG: pyridoxamine kinase [Eubacterium sp.]|nr:pyridoxamine kinase [Eubacterium sp.]